MVIHTAGAILMLGAGEQLLWKTPGEGDLKVYSGRKSLGEGRFNKHWILLAKQCSCVVTQQTYHLDSGLLRVNGICLGNLGAHLPHLFPPSS